MGSPGNPVCFPADGKPLNQPNRSEKQREVLQGKRPFTET